MLVFVDADFEHDYAFFIRIVFSIDCAGPVNFTLRNVLELSKNIIGSIQQNLKDFAAGSSHQDASMRTDTISDHRRPNSSTGNHHHHGSLLGLGGGAGGLGFSGAGGGGGSTEELYFEEEEDVATFDMEDYAFSRARRPTRNLGPSPVLGSHAMMHGGANNNTNNMHISSSGRHSPHAINASAAAVAVGGSIGSSSNSPWPTKRCVLHSMESIIGGKLFVIDYSWNPLKMCTELVAQQFVSK